MSKLNKGLFTSETDLWSTPQTFFDELNKEFSFTLDPCATHDNHKCDKYYTKEEDGLKQSWDNEIVFCNPPYGSEIKYWIEKASKAMGGGSCDVTSSKNRYTILPRIHLRESRDPFYQRAVKVWRKQRFSTFS